ncbi:MAG TPA: CsiV family protein [Steroidobacteraceae bacterium]|nr:CsiV family protein [Steroidobacteraceae bacterium]
MLRPFVHRTPRRLLASALLGALLLALGLPRALPAEPGTAATPSAAGTARAAATVATAAAAPAAPLYQVEMVVFRATYVGTEENWSSVPTSRGFGTPLGAAAQAAQMVRTLAPSDYRLDGVVRGLSRGGSWRPIAHVAWVQTAPPWGSDTGIPLSQLGVNAPGLTGTVYLERARLYLHLGFDVTLDAGAPYRIDEMRSVRANEKQYFDHPAFGIIAAVYPIKRPAH